MNLCLVKYKKNLAKMDTPFQNPIYLQYLPFAHFWYWNFILSQTQYESIKLILLKSFFIFIYQVWQLMC